MPTEQSLRDIASKYTTPFIYDNLQTNITTITVSTEEALLKKMFILASLKIDQDQNVEVSVKVLNKIASDIGATGYLSAADKVAAEIYDVMIADGYTCVQGDKAKYVEHYVNTFKDLTTQRKKDVNVFLLNFTTLPLELNRSLIDPCRFSTYYTDEEKKDMFDGSMQRKNYIMFTRTAEIAAKNYTKNKECGVNDSGQIIWPPSSISQTIDVKAAVEIVNTVYVDAYNPADFTKATSPTSTTPPPTEEGAPVWILVGVFIVLLLMIGTTIILSQ